MTRSQFAFVAGASEKWVENSIRLLGRRVTYTATEARWLGLIRLLTVEVGVTLSRAAELADEALRLPVAAGSVSLGRKEGDVAGVVVDLPRFYSSYAAALSAAMDLGGGRRRGRPRAKLKKKARFLERAVRYGVDTDLLREGLKLSASVRLDRLDENAAFINALRAPRRSSAVSHGGRR